MRKQRRLNRTRNSNRSTKTIHVTIRSRNRLDGSKQYSRKKQSSIKSKSFHAQSLASVRENCTRDHYRSKYGYYLRNNYLSKFRVV